MSIAAAHKSNKASSKATSKGSRPKARKGSTTSSPPVSSTTKALLLDSAQKHFSKSGFGASSVHQIANDAGVNVSLISYHFGGKEGLFKSCIERAGLDRQIVTERILDAEPTSLIEVKCRLSMFVDAVLLDGINNPEIFTIMLQGLQCDFPLIQEVYQQSFHRIFNTLVEFLEAARKKNILAEWVIPELSVHQLMGAIIHMLRTDAIRKRMYNNSITDPAFREMARDYIVKTFLEGQVIAAQTNL